MSASFLNKYYLLIGVLVLLIFAFLFTQLLGQPVFCDCSYIDFWNGFTHEVAASQHLIDWYTFSHVIFGITIFALLTKFFTNLPLRLKLLLVLTIVSILELLENTEPVLMHFRSVTISREYFGDSLVNSIGDILAAFAGGVLLSKTRTWLIVILITVVELVSFYFIRDNLSLGIIMFLFPNDLILNMQLQ